MEVRLKTSNTRLNKHIVLSLLMPHGNKIYYTAKTTKLAPDLPLPTGMHRPSEFLTGSSFSMSNLMRAKGKNTCGIQWQSSWLCSKMPFSMQRNACCHTYPADNIDTADHSDFIGVIDEADISLCGSIELSDMNASEAVQEVFPDLCSYAITNGDLHLVVSVIVFLQSGKHRTAQFVLLSLHCLKVSNTIVLSKIK